MPRKVMRTDYFSHFMKELLDSMNECPRLGLGWYQEALGISYPTFYNWRKRNTEIPKVAYQAMRAIKFDARESAKQLDEAENAIELFRQKAKTKYNPLPSPAPQHWRADLPLYGYGNEDWEKKNHKAAYANAAPAIRPLTELDKEKIRLDGEATKRKARADRRAEKKAEAIKPVEKPVVVAPVIPIKPAVVAAVIKEDPNEYDEETLERNRVAQELFESMQAKRRDPWKVQDDPNRPPEDDEGIDY